MRTDSTNLAQVAVDAARDLVEAEYGRQFLPDSPRVYRSKVKNAQEAHEAIRPAGHPFKLPEAIKPELNYDQFRLFDLIWKRTIASQMADATGHMITLTIEGGGAVFQVSGKTIDFPGFLRAYVEGSDDPEAELANQERLLPAVRIHDPLEARELQTKGHATQPPARYSEASLTAELEGKGIGRPSTYASIIDTILYRKYVFKKANALVPTWTAFSVCRLMEQHLPTLVDYEFTAQMEDLLDAISRQEEDSVDYLRSFYFGNGQAGLKPQLESKVQEIDPREMSRFSLGNPAEGPHREEVFVRVGKYGPFLEQGERKASIPDELPPDELKLEKALEMLDHAAVGDEPLGHDPASGKPIYLKSGRFGPYVQLGENDDEEKKYGSLMQGMTPADVTVELALKLLAFPRDLGKHPQSGESVQAMRGKFGPYIKCGSETRSLPREISPLDVTLEQAVELLAQPKQRGRGRAAAKAPLKTFDASPITGKPVQLLDGRYGPYVTDGTTNASLPKDASPESLTFDQALVLLAERAQRVAEGGGRRPAKGRPAARKAAPKKTDASPKEKKNPPKAKKNPPKAAKKPPRKKGKSKGDADDAPF
jgi:DNA topoisomerase-1